MTELITLLAAYYLGRIRQALLHRQNNKFGYHLGKAYEAMRHKDTRTDKDGDR